MWLVGSIVNGTTDLAMPLSKFVVDGGGACNRDGRAGRGSNAMLTCPKAKLKQTIAMTVQIPNRTELEGR